MRIPNIFRLFNMVYISFHTPFNFTVYYINLLLKCQGIMVMKITEVPAAVATCPSLRRKDNRMYYNAYTICERHRWILR